MRSMMVPLGEELPAWKLMPQPCAEPVTEFARHHLGGGANWSPQRRDKSASAVITANDLVRVL
jgi:hypothetical protein